MVRGQYPRKMSKGDSAVQRNSAPPSSGSHLLAPEQLVQMAKVSPHALNKDQIMQLQRTFGNGAVLQMMNNSLAQQKPGKEKRESDHQINKATKKKMKLDTDDEESNIDLEEDVRAKEKRIEAELEKIDLIHHDELNKAKVELQEKLKLIDTPEKPVDKSLREKVGALSDRIATAALETQKTRAERVKAILAKEEEIKAADRDVVSSEEDYDQKLKLNTKPLTRADMKKIDKEYDRQAVIDKLAEAEREAFDELKAADKEKWHKQQIESLVNDKAAEIESNKEAIKNAKLDVEENLAIKNDLQREMESLSVQMSPPMALVQKEIAKCKTELYWLQNPKSTADFKHKLTDLNEKDLEDCKKRLTDVESDLFKKLLKVAGLATHHFAAVPDDQNEIDIGSADTTNAQQVGIFGYGTNRVGKTVKVNSGSATASIPSSKLENAKPWALPGNIDTKPKDTTRPNLSGVQIGPAIASYESERSHYDKVMKNDVTDQQLATLLLSDSIAEMDKHLTSFGTPDAQRDEIKKYVIPRRVLLNLESARNRSSAPFHALAMIGVRDGWRGVASKEKYSDQQFHLPDYYSKDGLLNPMAPVGATAKGGSHAEAKSHRRNTQFHLLKDMLTYCIERVKAKPEKPEIPVPVSNLAKAIVNYMKGSAVDEDSKIVKDAFHYLLENRNS
ncbi:hypothetical protein [Tumebacillus lipolyticus]|uniref:GRIP domain-containing protein n=1 Tax=Tumebacillus lipolyticus TaxID=1280370 RepID=A0ABW4ZZ11_9BACL